MEVLFRQILVPVDGSEPSLQAMQMALRLIRLCPDCRLTALFVIDKLVVAELVRFGTRGPREMRAEVEEEGRRYLELARKDAERHGVAAEMQTREGDPFEEIVSFAKELRADLIVMGHTGQRGTARVLIGSVTQRVLDYAPCPVLVTRGV